MTLTPGAALAALLKSKSTGEYEANKEALDQSKAQLVRDLAKQGINLTFNTDNIKPEEPLCLSDQSTR